MLAKSFSTNFAAVDEIIFKSSHLTFLRTAIDPWTAEARWLPICTPLADKAMPASWKAGPPGFLCLGRWPAFFPSFFFFFNLNFQNFYEKNMIEGGLNPRLFPTIPHYPFDHGSRSEDYLDCKSYASMITIVSIFFSLLLGFFFFTIF